MATSSAIRARIDAFAHELAMELGQVDARGGDCWLDAIENQAIELGDAVTAELARQLAARRANEVESRCPTCGHAGHDEGPRERTLIGRRGPVAITEPEYFCPCCRKAFFPADGSDRR
jgi:hypothetical protein